VETYYWLAVPEVGCWVTVQGCASRLGGDLNNGLAAQLQRAGGSASVTQMSVRGVLCMLRGIQIDAFTFTFTLLDVMMCGFKNQEPRIRMSNVITN